MTSGSDFAEVYARAVYRAGGCTFTLKEEPTGEQLFGGCSFVIITAYNPYSNPSAVVENERRHQSLEKELRVRGLEHAPSAGVSLDGSWQEPGFVIFGVTLEAALELGRRFEQHAVVWGEGERALLAWCEDGRLETFYPRVIEEASA